MRHRVITALAAGLLTVAFAGCGGDDPSSSRRPEIDARGYFEDYRETAVDMASGGAMPTTMAPTPTAGHQRRCGTTGLARPLGGQRVRRQRRLDVRGDGRRRRVDVRPRRRHRLLPHRPAPSWPAVDLPDPASIRVEEWVNAFDYDDPAPTDGPVGVGVETAAAPHTDDGTALVRIAVDTATVADDDRPPANITFVIDTSGSMDIRDRLGLVQSSLALLVQHLRDDDTISIVTYGDDATPVLAPTKVD